MRGGEGRRGKHVWAVVTVLLALPCEVQRLVELIKKEAEVENVVEQELEHRLLEFLRQLPVSESEKSSKEQERLLSLCQAIFRASSSGAGLMTSEAFVQSLKMVQALVDPSPSVALASSVAVLSQNERSGEELDALRGFFKTHRVGRALLYKATCRVEESNKWKVLHDRLLALLESVDAAQISELQPNRAVFWTEHIFPLWTECQEITKMGKQLRKGTKKTNQDSNWELLDSLNETEKDMTKWIEQSWLRARQATMHSGVELLLDAFEKMEPSNKEAEARLDILNLDDAFAEMALPGIIEAEGWGDLPKKLPGAAKHEAYKATLCALKDMTQHLRSQSPQASAPTPATGVVVNEETLRTWLHETIPQVQQILEPRELKTDAVSKDLAPRFVARYSNDIQGLLKARDLLVCTELKGIIGQAVSGRMTIGLPADIVQGLLERMAEDCPLRPMTVVCLQACLQPFLCSLV